MQTPSCAPDAYQDLLTRLPPDLDLDVLARSSKAIERGRRLSDGATLLRLALARGPGGLSLNQTAAWAALQGLPVLSGGLSHLTKDRSGERIGPSGPLPLPANGDIRARLAQHIEREFPEYREVLRPTILAVSRPALCRRGPRSAARSHPGNAARHW